MVCQPYAPLQGYKAGICPDYSSCKCPKALMTPYATDYARFMTQLSGHMPAATAGIPGAARAPHPVATPLPTASALYPARCAHVLQSRCCTGAPDPAQPPAPGRGHLPAAKSRCLLQRLCRIGSACRRAALVRVMLVSAALALAALFCCARLLASWCGAPLVRCTIVLGIAQNGRIARVGCGRDVLKVEVVLEPCISACCAGWRAPAAT